MKTIQVLIIGVGLLSCDKEKADFACDHSTANSDMLGDYEGFRVYAPEDESESVSYNTAIAENDSNKPYMMGWSIAGYSYAVDTIFLDLNGPFISVPIQHFQGTMYSVGGAPVHSWSLDISGSGRYCSSEDRVDITLFQVDNYDEDTTEIMVNLVKH